MTSRRGQGRSDDGSSGDDPPPIGAMLDRVLRGLGTPGVAAVHTVFTSWETLVGDEVAAHARPVSLDGGCLLVAVDAPGWATRVRYGQADLLDRCAAALGAGVVTRVDVRVRGDGRGGDGGAGPGPGPGP